MQEPSVQQPQPSQENQGKPLEAQLAEALAKVEEQRDQMMRALAETDNIRKRLQGEAANAQKYALERFAGDLLPVVDSLEAAVHTADVSGIEVILRQLKAALDKGHIREINPAPGERFDPHRQQAMAAVEADADPNTVVAVMQKGYCLHDRVLRPALVTVAKARSEGSEAVEKSGGNPTSNTDFD